MRVIAGTARSMPLKTPEGTDTRPTTDRIKETLFNILQNEIPGAVFVDMYSGSGGIGIEALSRGAKKAYFIENSPKAIACIQENLVFTKLADKAVVLKQEASLGLSSIFEKEVDIIFMDPPYEQECEKHVLQVLYDIKYVTDNTLIIVETSIKTDMEYAIKMGYSILREKKYKTNKHWFLKKSQRL
ncbi:MAG: 16S rRNA (guanine(966)-N(2))-methyltransferase RsmD [Lachnospiraceae bacterium]|nr:16S rRNA (guanine(966)-N(2))-methyltransferase RsmD [Lachnospiraceae bacterium]